MESVNRKIIAISLILAVISVFMIYIYIKKATALPEADEYINVYTAAKTLPSKHIITNADIKQVKVLKEYLNSKAVLKKADIVGKRLKDSVIEGEQILRDRLIDEDNTALAYNIPQGKRAVSIDVNDQISVSNLLRPGDYVDVIVSFETEEFEGPVNKTLYPRVTKTIIQNVEVLALGQEQNIKDEKTKEPPKTITLAVSPEEAESLVYATEYGTIRLALRPVEDADTINTHGVIRSDIAADRGKQVVPK
jgi:pilus assembly protein CpaB